MIGARLGNFLDGPLAPIVKKIGISPNAITLAGFAVSAASGYVLSRDLVLGGAVVLAAGVLDMLDGMVARTSGKVSEFGAYLDSVLDRYSDAFIFLGLAWYMAGRDEVAGVALSLGTLVGAFLVSYARARAEGLGVDCKTGILERPERIGLVIFGCFTGWMVQVLWAMFFLTHLTVAQRMLHVRKRTSGRLP